MINDFERGWVDFVSKGRQTPRPPSGTPHREEET